MVSAPSRRAREEADIEALFAAHGGTLDGTILRDYSRVFDPEADLDRLLATVGER